jgi:S-formylglutathione hydrolase
MPSSSTPSGDVPELLSRHACFAGAVSFHRHVSVETGSAMRFAVFTPPQAQAGPVPVLYYLAGLTCTEETFMMKAGASRLAAELGIMLVAPDTSPRDPRLPGDDESWDFGLGAGFYVDAIEAPWSRHYRMYSYVARELPAVIARHFPARPDAQSIFGHSMGGHGALVVALRNPEQYRSVSAFAPITSPMTSPWGEKAFSRYLGTDRNRWADYDASFLVGARARGGTILVDQGTADKFLEEQLRPDALVDACRRSGQRIEMRLQPGYDHGYYFISTFISDHLRFHASRLG